MKCLFWRHWTLDVCYYRQWRYLFTLMKHICCQFLFNCHSGDDTFGRKVIVFSACNLPPRAELDHQKLLRFLFDLCTPCESIFLSCEVSWTITLVSCSLTTFQIDCILSTVCEQYHTAKNLLLRRWPLNWMMEIFGLTSCAKIVIELAVIYYLFCF